MGLGFVTVHGSVGFRVCNGLGLGAQPRARVPILLQFAMPYTSKQKVKTAASLTRVTLPLYTLKRWSLGPIIMVHLSLLGYKDQKTRWTRDFQPGTPLHLLSPSFCKLYGLQGFGLGLF